MGIIADTMAEVVERSRNDMAGQAIDLRQAESVEFLTGLQGEVWVNVDGVLALRIQQVGQVFVDTTNVKEPSKTVLANSPPAQEPAP